jgi:hypothetical protein
VALHQKYWQPWHENFNVAIIAMILPAIIDAQWQRRRSRRNS